MRLGLLLVAALSAAGSAAPGHAASAARTRSSAGAEKPPSTARIRAAALNAELEAARTHRLYLVLDPTVPALDVMTDGLLLRRFPVESALFGLSRLAGGAVAWPAYGYTLASEIEEPERPKIPIQEPEPTQGTESGPALPATAQPAFSEAREEALAQSPTHFRLRFYPTLDLSILGEAGVANLPGRLWRLRHRLLEGWEAAALRLRGEPMPPRVVLTLRPEEARRLFLVLAPRTRLIIRPSAPAKS